MCAVIYKQNAKKKNKSDPSIEMLEVICKQTAKKEREKIRLKNRSVGTDLQAKCKNIKQIGR